ncbi:MAG: hypothetical protein KatS3mg112_0521 [Thermogutta sp.]|nr:MAG: hypothetical protein KatS3mg112_0521 [Thermogutta sp.]
MIFRLGIEFRPRTPLVPPGGNGITLQELQNKYDAVLLALGEQTPERLEQLGIPHTQRGITINRETFQTPLDRIFAAGNAIRGRGLVVRSCADGKLAARCIDQFLRLGRVEGIPEMFSVRMGRLEREEVEQLATLAEPIPRTRAAARGSLGRRSARPSGGALPALRLSSPPSLPSARVCHPLSGRSQSVSRRARQTGNHCAAFWGHLRTRQVYSLWAVRRGDRGGPGTSGADIRWPRFRRANRGAVQSHVGRGPGGNWQNRSSPFVRPGHFLFERENRPSIFRSSTQCEMFAAESLPQQSAA